MVLSHLDKDAEKLCKNTKKNANIEFVLTIVKLRHKDKMTYIANADVSNWLCFSEHGRSDNLDDRIFRYSRSMNADVYDYGISVPNHKNNHKKTQQ